jgi:hypothetical protein
MSSGPLHSHNPAGLSASYRRLHKLHSRCVALGIQKKSSIVGGSSGPACVATTDTLEEIQQLMKEGIELHLAGFAHRDWGSVSG